MVSGNCIVGPGDYAFQIHGGAGNRLTANRIDAAAIFAVLLNQSPANDPRRPMPGNVLERNRVYNGATTRLVHNVDAGAGQLLVVSGNATPPGGLRCPAR